VFDIDWDSITDESAILAVLEQTMTELGMSACAFNYTPISNMPGGQPGVMKRALTYNVPEPIVDDWYRYQDFANGVGDGALSHAYDPVRRIMSQKVLPQRIIMRDLLSDRAAVRNVAAATWVRSLMQSGIRETFHAPVFTGRGEYWSLGALRYDDNPNDGDLTEEQYAYLNWVTSRIVWICIERLNWRRRRSTTGNRALTQRELDCLFWAAHGHSAMDTAEVLEISVETVRKHIKNAAKRLNARNKTQAVFAAHRLGYLPLS